MAALNKSYPSDFIGITSSVRLSSRLKMLLSVIIMEIFGYSALPADELKSIFGSYFKLGSRKFGGESYEAYVLSEGRPHEKWLEILDPFATYDSEISEIALLKSEAGPEYESKFIIHCLHEGKEVKIETVLKEIARVTESKARFLDWSGNIVYMYDPCP